MRESQNYIARVRLSSTILIIAISALLSLSGCGSSFTAKSEIQNLRVKFDENFSGSLNEWKKQNITFEWEIASAPEKESYTIEILFGPSLTNRENRGTYFRLDEPVVFKSAVNKLANFGTVDEITASGNRRVFVLKDMEIAKGTITQYSNDNLLIPLGLLAEHKPGDKVVFSVTLNSGDPKKESDVKSEAVWVRPALVSTPQAPVLKYESENADSTEPCTDVYDIGTFSFDSRPLILKSKVNGKLFDFDPGNGKFFREVLLGYTDESIGDLPATWLGLECDGVGRSYTYEVTFENEIGASKSASISFRSVKPGRTQADIDAENKKDLIRGCTNALRITENSATSVDCGYIKVKVFQSDLDTGSCRFLGNWTDRNGSSRVGIFEYCDAFQAGSFKEDFYYTLYVKVDGPTTYTTRLGTERSVLAFSVITNK